MMPSPTTFEDWRSRLPERSFAWRTGAIEYTRDSPQTWCTVGPGWSVGFVLHRLEKHEGRIDGPDFRSVPLAPGMGWFVPPGAEVVARWHEPCDYVSVELTEEAFAGLRVPRPETLRSSLEILDAPMIHIALALLTAKAREEPLYRNALSNALAVHLLHRHAGHA